MHVESNTEHLPDEHWELVESHGSSHYPEHAPSPSPQAKAGPLLHQSLLGRGFPGWQLG